MRKLSPVQQHKLFVIAAKGGRILAASGVGGEGGPAANDDGAPQSHEEAMVRLQLLDHKRTLKAIQSVQTKIVRKGEFLPLYADWVAGVLAADSGRPDEVLATVLIWRIDVGDILGALPLASYVLRHRLPLPAHIQRTPATFITEQVAIYALEAFEQGLDQDAAAELLNSLGALEELVLLEDMHDEVRAKLQKAIAKGLLVTGEEENERVRQAAALERYLQALKLDPKAGVKKDVDALQRQLKKGEGAATPPAETPPVIDGPAVAAAPGAALATIAEQNTPPSPEGG